MRPDTDTDRVSIIEPITTGGWYRGTLDGRTVRAFVQWGTGGGRRDHHFRVVEVREQGEDARAEALAGAALATYRDEFPTGAPDEPWFTTAYEYERDPGCSWAAYWDAVQRLAAGRP